MGVKTISYLKRKAEVESVFGQIKCDWLFRRFSFRGLDKFISIKINYPSQACRSSLNPLVAIQSTLFVYIKVHYP